MKKKTPALLKRTMAVILVFSMFIPGIFAGGAISVSANDSDILYENAGPVAVAAMETVTFGDSSWTDYEWECDVTPSDIDGGGFVILARGGAYYSFVSGSAGNAEWCWTALSQISGANTGEWNRIAFCAGKVTHIRFKAESTMLSLYYQYDGDTSESKVYETSIEGFGGTVMTGGVGFQSRGANTSLEISNIVVRGLSGNDPGTDPVDPGDDKADVSVDSIEITSGFSQTYGEASWTDYVIEFDAVGMTNAGISQWPSLKIHFRENPGNNLYRLVIEPGGRTNVDGVVNGSGWGTYLTNYSGSNAFAAGANVHYKLAVEGANIKLFVNGTEAFDYTDSNASRASALAAGKITLVSEGVNGTIENFKITRIDSEKPVDPKDPPVEPGEPGIVYQSAGPKPLPVAFGDSTWQDYEFEFDITPASGSAFRVSVRGGAYYSWINGSARSWPGIQPSSGQGGEWKSNGIDFAYGQTTHLRFVVQGTKISLYYKGPNDTDETKDWEVDVTPFGTPVLNGGVSITSEGLSAEITNIVARDLKGNIAPVEPDPGDDDEGKVVVDIIDPINASDGDSAWYGQTTWQDYIVETTVSNLTDTGTNGQYPNLQFKLRGEFGSYYYIYIGPNGAVNLQDTINWAYLTGTYTTAPTGGNSVDYKFEVIGNKLSVYANGNLLYTYEETRADVHTKGQIGWGTQGTTATIESLKVTLLDKDAEDKPPVTTGAVEILSPKVPVAGIYPISAYKYNPNAWDNSANWRYTETIEWSPVIQNTFLTNMAYTATVTLTPNSGYSFAGRTIADIGGIYLDAVDYASARIVGENLVITFNFPATGNTAAVFEEFKNTLFYDDFSGTKLDMNKWDNPLNYNNQTRGGNSTWESKNISVADGNLRLRFAKESATSNWISTGAARTRNKFDNAYGYYEARIKYPAVDPKRSGSWGAFWLMYYNSDSTGKSGMEIDIVEFAGVHNNWASGGLHWDGYGDNHKSTGFMRYDGTPENTIYDGKFHTYALEWTPTEYISYVDGAVSGRMTKQDMQKVQGDICENPLYIKFSIESSATGPNWNMGWGGPMPQGVWEDYLEVDYVAVYDRPKSAAAVYITDYATVELDATYDGAQAQVKATVKNVNQFVQGTVSGTVSFDTPEGIILGETSKTYENLAYGETAVLYFDINPAYPSVTASEVIKFNYTVDGLEPVGSAQMNYGVVEAAKAVEDDIFANSAVIDFAKGTVYGGSVSASTLNPDDLSATGKLAWDEDYLYAQIVVTDDVHNQTNGAGNRWNDDGVQIAVGNGVGHREMEFVLASNLATIYQQCYSNSTGAAGGNGIIAQGDSTMQSEITRDEDANTTIYNIKINWAYVGISNPTAGDVAKIAVTINDNDGSGRKDLAYFDGISTGSKGEGMGYLVLMPEKVNVYLCDECGAAMNFGHQEGNCYANGFDYYACGECGYWFYVEIYETIGHSLVLVETRSATCEANGAEFYACDKEGCGYWEYGEIFPALGHDLELIYDADKNQWFNVCRRNDCGYWEYADAPVPPAISDAELVKSITADVLNAKKGFDDVKGVSLVLEGKTLKLVFDDREIILNKNANNKNVSGEVDLGGGYWLVYDIKGNGSNVKEFKIIQK